MTLKIQNCKNQFLGRCVRIGLVLIVSLMAIYFAFKGVYWLMMPFCVPPVVLGLGFLMRCFFKQEILKSNFIYPFILAGLIAAAIYLRVFLFDVFLIPSNSMRDTLYPGDKVLVEKWSMGPKMPDSPLEVPWLNLVYYIGHKMGIETRIPQWSQKRLKGLGGVCHNDVLVYFAEDDESTQAYIKRCIALPGDTLQIVNSRVMINGRELFQPSRLRHYYSMRYTDSQNALTELKTIDVSIETSCYDKQMIFAYLNLEQKDYLLNSKYFESIDLLAMRTDSEWATTHWFPEDNWTIDDLGPIIIPYKGMKIENNLRNQVNYASALIVNDLDEKSAHELKELRIENDYFFVVGDHRHDSKDSRYTGFVSDDQILGKAIVVLYNKNEPWKFGRYFVSVK